MVAAVTVTNLDRFRSFCFLWPMFRFKNIRELTCLFVAACVLVSRSAADGQDFVEDFMKREYSLVKPYRGLGFSTSSQWHLMGTAMITPDHVRLTPDLQSRQGAVWSRMPLLVRDWELQVQFKIHGLGKKNLNGDGMAFWLTKERMQNGPVFGNMNQFTGLGIFVDTYPNSEHSLDRMFPYVSVMLGNGSLSYDQEYDGRPTDLGGCSAAIRNSIYDTFLLVRYSKNRLTLRVDVDGKQEWKDCADITGLRLPSGYFFGASSATGDLSDNHDLISMKLFQLTVERTPEEEEDDKEEVTIPTVDNMEQFQDVSADDSLLLCSGSPGGGDERSAVLHHHRLLHRGPRRAVRGGAVRVRPLERKQTQALLLTREWPLPPVFLLFLECVAS
ncbi:lectin, mannose-binding 2-like b isoform X2 [Cyclopterus lumpus]|uniref:lectin, mannose-binding 2-like b isoform X2 n=1 Tax=Cyclopterus lumpus TaxID=8103 RepID=UPI0014874515|nr:lectin, mannose-binding 2-like b isoform X2 [Cyclopterus lumpus]